MNADQLRALRAARLTDAGLIAVIRAPSAGVVPTLGAALVAGGITSLEVTTSTPDFAEAIRATKLFLGETALVGAGTILNAGDLRAALAGGAEFIVSPVLRPELVPPSHQAGCPILLGAYTPTEAQAACEAGADFVKLFPADTLGPGFIRALLAPLPHLRLVPTGGVTVANAAEFRKAGCVAVGLGGHLLKRELIQAQDWPALTRLAAEFVAAWQG
ncbi:MAG TPA: bifunctional 4-hydroxy-2-oxoglutarate aldolase/2-dehydro-3-deoxy-phosphogluconate aldolase [Candidatus Limnocylindria bacterium]|jgi:2-dehydro-3-deoxyphosphogluconate aldolase/(4S)-4-hydroxy-2-oxoglutarate aldolase|nr:bifunctional 4-hydroxy-2-oxoglutarate aldolase/2-dehydro-3-deoxy-phosphogluconate aldolase [Candidatus Limnocylindria bacterium]